MIHYQLRCGTGHEFDGWFRGSAAYEEQARRGLLECPVCGERQIERALMAPSLPRGREAPIQAPSAPPQPQAQPDVQPGSQLAHAPAAGREAILPDQLRAVLHRLRGEIERQCEYVGDRFAVEARRIHEGESERRGIFGEATPAEAESLAEDGIEVSRIPWLPRADA